MKTAIVLCIFAAAAVPLVMAGCDAEAQCSPAFEDSTGKKLYWDFHSLCNPGGDYHLTDGAGHDYYAQICGTTTTTCLPKTWTNTYETGVAIQNWGDAPACNPNDPQGCTNKQDGTPACCTKDCQVLGTGLPVYSLENPQQPVTGGIRVAFRGAPPTPDDPFWCPWNPATGAQYDREVHYVFFCSPETKGYAQPIVAKQNTTDDCKYELHFNTASACGSYTKPGTGSGSGSNYGPGGGNGSGGNNKIGGGWVFIIILLVCGSVYVVAGTLLVYSRERVWRFPNSEFWGYVGGLVTDGVKFVASGFKGQGGASTGGVATGGGGAYDDLGASGGAAAGGAAAGGAAGGSAYGSSAYQADTAEAPKTTAYTDL